MTSRDKILSKIKNRKTHPIALPNMEIVDKWDGEINIETLQETIKSVGGDMHILDSIDDVVLTLKELFPNVKMTYSNMDGLDFGNVDICKVNSAHELAKLEIAVLEGEFAVEENGAVFVRDDKMGNRMIPTITEYLVLVLPKKAIVKNMHEAYKNINLKKIEYGVFISGPSKTADIESTLVFGAHGAKNLTLLLI